MPVVSAAMSSDVMRDVFKRQLRRCLASPIGQARADWFGVFEARNVMAAEATIFGNRLAADVLQALAVFERLALGDNQVLLRAFQLPLQIRRNSRHVILLRR